MRGLFVSVSRPRSHALALWVLLFLGSPQLGWAVGTVAGTAISNSVTLTYNGVIEINASSAPFTVDEKILPTLTWQDGTPISVSSPGVNGVLTFKLTNSGNGQEAFSLVRINGPAPLPAGNYTPSNGTAGSIYLENSLQAGFQATGPNADTAYISGTNDPDLAPDAQQTIYVISDTPSGYSGQQGEVKLTATSKTAGAAGSAAGTSLVGLGQGGSVAVVGIANAESGDIGAYIASGLGLVINKTIISTVDPSGGSVLMSGTELTYQIAVTVSGSGTATNLVVTDPIPANTTYVANSTALDAIAQTDAVDADKTQFAANTITVSLGNVAAPANIVITFRATVN